MELPRAVIYCRCSTEEESQADALRIQIQESEACVKEQGWFLADRYVELKSGTTTKGRTEYNRLFEDMLSGKFDIIVIKSQDRLMRNVKDWYLFLDRMLSHGKRLFMYIERKFYTADDTLITGIKAILAEEYSRELSKKSNNAHRYRQTHGGKAMLTSRVFGFCKMPDGSLKVVEEEAEIIRKIYEYSAAGYGSRSIANIFLNQGYVKRTGNPLTAVSVGRIIRNPLYMGTMVMNRFHHDFETKRTVKISREQWVYKEGAVPAIVDKDLWEQANLAMTDRAVRFHQDGIYKRGSSTGRYDLSGKMVCAKCGRPYYRTWRQGYSDKEHVVIEWKCSNYLMEGRKEKGKGNRLRKTEKKFDGGCDNVHLNENVVFDILEKAAVKYYNLKEQDKNRVIDHTVRILRKALDGMPVKQEWGRIKKEEKRLEEQKDFLLTKFVEGIVSDEDYQKKNGELEKMIDSLKQQKDSLVQRVGGMRNLEQRIKKIKSRLENGGIERAFVNQMFQDIKEIQVHEWQLEICFEPLKLMGGVFSVWVDYPFGSGTVRGRYLDRRNVMKLLKEDPGATAKKLAAEMGCSVYMVRNRMEELIKGGYIRFNGRGGHGTWEILKELPDKKESIKAGGL